MGGRVGVFSLFVFTPGVAQMRHTEFLLLVNPNCTNWSFVGRDSCLILLYSFSLVICTSIFKYSVLMNLFSTNHQNRL